MKNLFLIILAVVLFSSKIYAQTGREVSGVVQDTSGMGVIAATVKLVPLGTTDTVMIRSNADGIFVFKDVKSSEFLISITSLGYAKFNKRYLNGEGTTRLILDPITLKPEANMLNEVVINGTPTVTIKEDTIEFRASDYKLRENATAEDLVRKLDGVEVDKDGNVSTAGKSITKVRLNGKDLFGGDAKTALQNIPAEMLEKVQIIDDYGDQANFTGVKDGDPEKILNFTTLASKNKGYTANGTVGGGGQNQTGEKGLYQAAGFGSYFNGNRTIGGTFNLNNNNSQVAGGGFGGRGGGGGGANFGGGQGSGGITKLGGVGLTYSDNLSKKVQLTSSYQFNSRDNTTETIGLEESPTGASGLLRTNSDIYNVSSASTHNFMGRLQYNIDSANALIIQPTISYSENNSTGTTETKKTGAINQNQEADNLSNSNTPRFGGNLLFNHNFKKKGAFYSLNINVNNQESNGYSDNDSKIFIYNKDTALNQQTLYHPLIDTDNKTFSSTLRFIPSIPLNKAMTNRLQFSYELNYNNYDNNKITSLEENGNIVVDPTLSNIFAYSFTTHRIGFNLSHKGKYSEVSVGLTGQPSVLDGSSQTLGTSIHRTAFNVAPIFRYTYRYSRTRTININYNGRPQEPQFAQLQPVRDVSNPQRPIVGNPNLKLSFTHSIMASYNNSNLSARSSFNANIQGNAIQNRISSNQVLVDGDISGVPTRVQEIRYVNTNGYYSLNGRYNYNKSFANRQYVVSYTGSGSYLQNPSFSDNTKYLQNNFVWTQRLGLQVNPGNWLEFTPSVLYRNDKTTSSSDDFNPTKIKTWSTDMDVKLYFLKGFIFSTTASKQFNSGYATAALNTSPFVVNAYLERKFLKGQVGTLRLSVFDLLKESNNITRTQLDNGGFNDSRTNRLTQYFMLTFQMRISKLGGRSQTGNQNQDTPGQRGGFPGGGPGGFPGGGGRGF